MENYFYFIFKALFILKIFKFLSRLFGHAEKQLDWKDKIHFKVSDDTTWEKNNCNTYIAQYLKK